MGTPENGGGGPEQVLADLGLGVVAAWKQRTGQKAVGHFPVYAPLEMIHAQGALPVSLFGGWGQIEIDHADSRLQSFVCSITKSTLELGLTGRLSVLDGMVFTNICDVARNLSGVWSRNFPAMMTVFLHMPQNVESPSARAHLASELRRLSASLERLTGVAYDPARLAESIALYNQDRDLLRRLEAVREEKPWALSAADWYLLLRIGTVIPKEEHVRMLEDAVAAAEASTARPRDGVRVLLLGSFCEQPPLGLVRQVEEAGCFIVEDDFVLGQRWHTRPIREEGDPLEALVDAYLGASRPSAVRHHGAHPRQRHLVERAKALRLGGVLFCTAKFCEPALYDYVLQKDALEAAGIPYLHVEYEEKMSAFEQPRTQVETFVESILFN